MKTYTKFRVVRHNGRVDVINAQHPMTIDEARKLFKAALINGMD